MNDDSTRAFSDRRSQERHDIKVDVDFRHGDTYLFCKSGNISEMGIFLVTPDPLSAGSRMELKFSIPGNEAPIVIFGRVMWVQAGEGEGETGMGVKFIDPTPEVSAQIKALIRTIAYLE
jgi:uncharacterized protein (TIGR02266 family)